MQWWGYEHTNNSIQVKRFFDQRNGQLDMSDARISPFCKEVVGPFEAENREDAIEKVKEAINSINKETTKPADAEGNTSSGRDPRRK